MLVFYNDYKSDDMLSRTGEKKQALCIIEKIYFTKCITHLKAVHYYTSLKKIYCKGKYYFEIRLTCII